jgi:phosphoesterase RecJ-like protein
VINDVDTIVVLDLNTVKRLDGLGEAIVASKARIVNIDHHTHPQDFAHVQCVDTDSPATCAMLYRLISTSSTLTLPPDAAQCLYTGIMTDTGNFRFPRTDAWLHRAVADLIEHGADPVSAYELTFNQNSLERTRLLGAALASLQVHHNGRLCTMFVRASDLTSLHCSVDDTEGLVHHTLSLQGVTMGILFVETDDIVKCSFRSKGETYVRDLAARYGGGGHVYAAGARVKGRPFTDVTTEVIAAAAEVL